MVELISMLPALADAGTQVSQASAAFPDPNVFRFTWQMGFAIAFGLPLAVMAIFAYEQRKHLQGMLRHHSSGGPCGSSADHFCYTCHHEWSDNQAYCECPMCGGDWIWTYFTD